MKFLILALFVAVAAAVPLDDNGPVELIVNGLPEGQPLEISNIVDIKLQEHSDGAVVATNVLHPLTASGIAEAAAAEIAANPVEVPEAVILPAPAQPEIEQVIPEAVVLPAPAKPEVVIAPEAVVLPAPAQPEVVISPEAVFLPAFVQSDLDVPAPVALPSPAVPEVVIPEAIVLPEVSTPEVIAPVPAQLPAGEVFNDGNVQVQVNVNSQETGYLSTIQGWFSMVVNYFNDGVQNSQQVV